MFWTIFVSCALLSFSLRAAALSIGGQLGLQHIWYHQLPSFEQYPVHYSSTEIPIFLDFLIQPTSNLTLQIRNNLTFKPFPLGSQPLGQNQWCNTGGTHTPPFSQSLCRFYDVSIQQPTPSPLISYESEIGLFLVGRRFQHWGLGIWQNSNLGPFGGKQDQVDGIGYLIDFAPFQVGAFWDIQRYSPIALSPLEQAFTFQILKQQETGEVKNSLNTTMGFVYSRFSSIHSSTYINSFDLTGEISNKFGWIGFEGVLLGGSTHSKEYTLVGGKRNLNRKNIDSWGGLLETEFLLQTDETDIRHLRKMRKKDATEDWRKAHLIGFSSGLASGQTTQFSRNNQAESFDDETNEIQNIQGFLFHPNIRPSLLMHQQESEFLGQSLASYDMDFPVGLSQRFLTNAFFTKFSYTFMNPSFGALTPSLIWSRLWEVPKIDEINPYERESSEEKLNPNLGIELDMDYVYRKSDGVTFFGQVGIWKPGRAWTQYLELNTKVSEEQKKLRPHEQTIYGIRLGTQLAF